MEREREEDQDKDGWTHSRGIRASHHQQFGGGRWPSGLASTGDRTVDAWFESHFGKKTFRFGTLAIPFTPICQCLSDERVKAVGPLYLVSMPGEVKYPTSPHWNV